ncbi:phage major capsid protein [Mediterraneibacter gnavus]|uniref:phage major capsid protein n=1 Tax=Mediterraneibacter gnavus TaxID=33038 RepID=UPI000466EB68|nr:phage major capsid protein [Mediterraneibacter gnavus]
MALRQLMLAKQIADKEKELEEIRGKDADFETREKELETSINEANTEEERSTVDDAITKFTEEKEAHEERKSELETELGELRGKMKEYEKAPEKREKEKDMGKRSEEIEEARSAINAFVKSKGQVRESGFKEADAGILIPVEILAPQEKPEDIVDLKNYVKNVSVNSASGKYPVIEKSGSKMNTVAELEQNPELAKPKITEINYSIATRRGYIPISQEAIDDADYDVTGLIRDEINDQSVNTRNTDIATVLKSATAKSVTGLDGLKDLVNKEIKKVYPVKFIISASLYAELDKLKDKNGRYLLQDSITSSSGKMLFGREVVVLDDDMIAGDGELKGFVGDPKSFCTFFDRKQTSVEWVDNQIYGKLLAGIVRYDVKKTDTNAGFYITYTPGE